MSVFSSLSVISRKRKMKIFYDIFKPDSQTKILDVGAEINLHPDNNDLHLIDLYQWKYNITAINIDKNHIDNINKHYPEVTSQVADACNLPYPDKYFDIVYSNAVIEHVGDYEKQKKMASEIMRVGKKWFITTPNRWYPFEFHLRLPFVTWLPFHGYLWIGRLISYNHIIQKYTFFNAICNDLKLLSYRKLHKCFPNSKIIALRVTFWPETLIAISQINIFEA